MEQPPRAPLQSALLLFVCLHLGPLTDRTTAVDYFWIAGEGDWTVGSNWDQGLSPEAEFEEEGVINNGGVAIVSASVADAAGLEMGTADGDSGVLRVVSGGAISFIDSSGTPAGVANIGLAGAATLDVQGGGSFSTTLLDVNAMGNVIIGGGAGAASVVSTGGMFLGGTTTVNGPGHTFSAAGAVALEGSGVYVANLSSTSHTVLSSAAEVSLDGSLKVQYNGAFAGVPGDRWDLFDASAVSGAFDGIDTSALPALGVGSFFRLSTVDGGVNGKLVQLVLDSAIVLEVDAGTGSASMSSPSGNMVEIAGYSILSPSGSLNVDEWSSLDDQSVPNWDEATPTANGLNELYDDAGSGFSVGASAISLGSPFVRPQVFGVAPDLTFEYVTNDNEVVQGLVEYTGSRAANNLLLTVDPATGDASLSNSSNFSISLVGYSVLSESGSLVVGEWSSLQDQGVGDWEEAAPATDALSELLEGDGMTLGPGQSYSLGSLFDEVSGSQDLLLEFVLDSESSFRTGAVVYGEPPDPGDLLGDYNNDGVVDAADYTLWRDNVGQAEGTLPNDGGIAGDIGQAHYSLWRSNYGAQPSSASAQSASVPEPAPLAMLLVGSFCRLCDWSRGKRRDPRNRE